MPTSPTPPTGLVLRGPAPQVSLASGSEQARDALLSRLAKLKPVSTPATLALSTEVIRDTKALLKSVETTRNAVLAPIRDLTKQVNKVAEDFVAKLETVLADRQADVNSYLASEERKRLAAEAAAREEAAKIEAARAAEAAAAERRLAAELARAKSETARANALARAEERQAAAADAASAAYAELPVAQATQRPEGLAVRTVPVFELLDVRALYAARPDLVSLEANGPAIRAALRAGLRNCAGLRIWEETSGIVKG